MKKPGKIVATRRDFIKGVSLAAGAGILMGCSPKTVVTGSPTVSATASSTDPVATGTAENCETELMKFFASSAAESEPITEAADGGEYEVIVVGAGTGGVPCAVKACQDGAKVLLLQKEIAPISQGMNGAGILLEESDPQAVWRWVEGWGETTGFRADWDQAKTYAYNSGEAFKWFYNEVNTIGECPINSSTWEADFGEGIGKVVSILVATPKPVSYVNAVTSLVNAYSDKLDVRFSTPAVQLIVEGKKITGVYAKDADGKYYKFTATKGVVLATGDYQNNAPMVERYSPDIVNFDKKQSNKTGDGHLMAMAIGAQMEPPMHMKMMHDNDTGPMGNEPFLRVDIFGNRFMNEEAKVNYMSALMRSYGPGEAGHFCQVWDSDYINQVTEWGGKPTAEEDMQKYMPEVEMSERPGVVASLVALFKADTLDELATKLGVPAENLKASVERYNQVVDSGTDEDFGKNPKYLKKIEKAPFFGVHKHVRASATFGGVICNGDLQVLDADRTPFENLYAIGNTSGQFFGCTDYPSFQNGISIGRCVTEGYYVGKLLAAK